jgi:hypothetical protein
MHKRIIRNRAVEPQGWVEPRGSNVAPRTAAIGGTSPLAHQT